MQVEIWSDVVCPWCYIGKRRVERALELFEHRDDVEVVWRSFQLDPTAQSAHERADGPSDRHARALAAKFGGTVEQAQAVVEQVEQVAAGEGLEFHQDVSVPATTVDAHQVRHLARERGVQGAVKERLLRAHFTEGEPVGDRDTLVRLAAEAGLDAAEVRDALDRDASRDAVAADIAEAVALGARGVPLVVVDRRYGVAGAPPAERFLEVFEMAWRERPALTVVGAPAGEAGVAGEACGPDGCAL